MRRAPTAPSGAVVFATTPISFAVREQLPGIDLDQISPRPGAGVELWLHCDASQELHDSLATSGITILRAPEPGPFGLAFTFLDPDGYAVTVHDKA